MFRLFHSQIDKALSLNDIRSKEVAYKVIGNACEAISKEESRDEFSVIRVNKERPP